MKHLLFLALLISFILGSYSVVNAQKKVNYKRKKTQTSQGNSIKFIKGIELNTDSSSTATAILEKKVKLSSITVAPTSINNYLNNIENCSSFQFKYAMIMNREVESINNLELYNFINDWWSTRYRFGGSDHEGIDCSSFTEKLFSNVYGYSVPRTSKEQFSAFKKVATKDLKEGDLVFFNTRSTRRKKRKAITHVGLYLGNNYFVHSSVSDGVTINSLSDEYYRKKFVSGGRFPLSEYKK